MYLGFLNPYTSRIIKKSWELGDDEQSLAGLPAGRLMIVVDFGIYLSGHEPKPTATQSSQT